MCRSALARCQACSSTPRPATSSSRAGSSTSGVPTSITARITDHQPTPSVRATEVTVSPSAPTRRVTHAFARLVSDCRGAPSGDRSVHVRTGHVGCGQRQIRFHHTNTVARPATGTSRSRCSRRSWTWAGPPH